LRPSFTALLPFKNDSSLSGKEYHGGMEEGGMNLPAVIFIREKLFTFTPSFSRRK